MKVKVEVACQTEEIKTETNQANATTSDNEDDGSTQIIYIPNKSPEV